MQHIIFKILFLTFILTSLGSSFNFDQYSKNILASEKISSLDGDMKLSLKNTLSDTALSVGQRIKNSFLIIDNFKEVSIYDLLEYKDLFLWCLRNCNEKDQIKIRPFLFKVARYSLNVMDEKLVIDYLISDKSLAKSYYKLIFRFNYLDKSQKDKLIAVILSKFDRNETEILALLSYLGDVKSEKILLKKFDLEVANFVGNERFNEDELETLLFYALLSKGNFFNSIKKYFNPQYTRKVGGEVCTINNKYENKLSIQVGDSFRLKSPGKPAFLVSRSDYLNCFFDDEREKFYLTEFLLRSARQAMKAKGLKTKPNLMVHVVKSRKGHDVLKQKELMCYLDALGKPLLKRFTEKFLEKKESYYMY